MNLQNHLKNSPLETLHVTSKKVSCQGKNNRDGNGDESLGHPLVYLALGADNSVTCPYCSKFFTLRAPTDSKE